MCQAVISALHMFNSNNHLMKEIIFLCPNF